MHGWRRHLGPATTELSVVPVRQDDEVAVRSTLGHDDRFRIADPVVMHDDHVTRGQLRRDRAVARARPPDGAPQAPRVDPPPLDAVDHIDPRERAWVVLALVAADLKDVARDRL